MPEFLCSIFRSREQALCRLSSTLVPVIRGSVRQAIIGQVSIRMVYWKTCHFYRISTLIIIISCVYIQGADVQVVSHTQPFGGLPYTALWWSPIHSPCGHYGRMYYVLSLLPVFHSHLDSPLHSPCVKLLSELLHESTFHPHTIIAAASIVPFVLNAPL